MQTRLITILIFAAVVATSLYFGLPRLGTFAGVDEPLWSYGRVPIFWKSIQESKWKKTNLCDKPGITLAAISGLGLPFADRDPEDYEKLRYEAKTAEDLQGIQDFYYHLRLPVFLFTLLMLLVFYFLMKKLLGKNTAWLSLIFIGLSPILLGISLMINTDAILWIILPLTLLSFLIYQKENNRKFLYLTGFLLGLALITKYIANILFPFFFLLIFLKYILDDEVKKSPDYFKKALLDYGILILIALITVFVLFPAAWVKPKMLLNVTIFSKAFYKTWYYFFPLVLAVFAETYFFKSKIVRPICDFLSRYRNILIKAVYGISLLLIFFVLANIYSGMKFFDFQPVFNSPSSELAHINEAWGEPTVIMLASFYSLIFGLTPLVALLFLFALAAGFKNAKIKAATDKNLYIFYFLLFILFYYLGSAASGVAPTVRYQIVIFPIASLIAAIGLAQLVESGSLKKYFLGARLHLLLFFVFVASFVSLKMIQPFYLSYASDLLPKKHVLNFRDMGDGSWEAGQYLNSLPGAGDLKVWSDKGAVCESFVGQCVDSLKKGNIATQNFDYFVVTAGRAEKSEFLGNSRDVEFVGGIEPAELYSPENKYVYRLNIDDRPGNFVKIMKVTDMLK